VKLPPRASKCLEYLDHIESLLDYYLAGTDEAQKLRTTELKYLRDYIAEISESKKLSQIKLAAKIKKDME